LANALAAEREQVFAKMKNGAATATARYHHLPVQHVSRRLLQIEWRVVPSVQTMLEALTRHTLVQLPGEASHDFDNLEQLSRQEQEARLLDLFQSGDRMGAVTMVRRLYSYDLTTATQFVEELVRKQPVRH
jgi:hypothetical protein